MTLRDRLVILVVLVGAGLAGFWFVGLAPKHKEAADLQSQIDSARQQLDDAQQKAAQARTAKEHYDRDYATIAKLGKAVPKSDALPSLLYQLQSAAHGARIDFQSLKVSAGGGVGPAPSTTSAAASAATATNGSSSSSSSSSASSSSSSSSSSSAPSTPSTPAPATQAAVTALPPGAMVGSAGFPTMPFNFVFNGSFFDMEQFFRDVQGFVKVNGDKVNVSGRLLSIDGFSLGAGANGFPSVTAKISATAYLRSPSDDDTSTSTATGGSSSTGTTSPGGASAPTGGTASEVAR
jgi:Tfp pilus assembly protein PilO